MGPRGRRRRRQATSAVDGTATTATSSSIARNTSECCREKNRCTGLITLPAGSVRPAPICGPGTPPGSTIRRPLSPRINASARIRRERLVLIATILRTIDFTGLTRSVDRAKRANQVRRRSQLSGLTSCLSRLSRSFERPLGRETCSDYTAGSIRRVAILDPQENRASL